MFGCKTNQTIVNKENCFYEKEGFIYINFYNLSNKPKLVPNISSILDERFYVLNDNYKLVNDTLNIQLSDKRNINISDAGSTPVIKVNDSLLMDKKERIQQIFKSNEKFNVISLNRDDTKSFFNRCGNVL